MKRFIVTACLCCCAMYMGTGLGIADTLTVPVNSINNEGIGEAIGTVTFTDDAQGGMTILVDVAGIAEGTHGMHVHEHASCAPAQKDGKAVAGLAAGGHYDPAHTGKHEGPGKHGHKGDLPAITANAQGQAQNTLQVSNLTTQDIQGRSLVIHAGGDNYADQPAPLGGGGARIACGVIQ